MRALAALVAVAVMTTGCFRYHRLAAPSVPDRSLPNVPLEGAPAPGNGRVLLEVQEGPAVVERIDGAGVSGVAGVHALSGAFEVARRVCVTPCVLDISPGPHELRFTLVDDDERTSSGFVNVDDRVSAYRHAIGTQRSRAWKGYIGWPVLLLGVLLDLGMTSAIAGGRFEANGGNITGATLAVGSTVLGGWLVAGSVVEQQPGSGVQWHP